jgi:4-amino-4-deoxy-L-arabinose transferase-like glycosyltransferase
VFLYLIAGRLTTREGALIALTLFLVWPFGVWLSRHFMPDAMLVAFLLAASLSVLRYWERPTAGRFAAAGFISALAVAVKPGVAFLFLLFLFGALALTGRAPRAALSRTLVFAALSASVTGVYYIVGTFASDFIWSEAGRRRLTLDLVVTGRFWSGWWESVSYLLRYPQAQGWLALLPIAAGAAGLVLAPSGRPRAVLAGLAVGYIAFALAFANYTSGNPYYSLPLLPILALSIGVLGGQLLQRLRPWRQAALLAAFSLLAAVAAFKSHTVLDVTADRGQIADYRRIGELTNHTTRAIVVDPELSTPLMYWGWLVGKAWELEYDEPPAWIEPEDADFLIVVGTSQFEKSSGLRAYVRGRRVVARTSRYAIFELRPTGTVSPRSG